VHIPPRRRPRRLARALAATSTLLLLGLPAAAPASVAERAARNGLADFDQVNATAGADLRATRTRSYDGARALRAKTGGAGGNAFARGIFNVDWREGESVHYGAAYYLPKGFKTSMQGQVDLLRWDNFPLDAERTDRSGIVVNDVDKRARLVRQKLGVEQEPLAAGFTLPEGRWFWLEVHQVLGRGAGARSTVRLDGRVVARSSAPNGYGRPVRRIRFGLVATDANRQRNALDLWFDRAIVSSRAIGPLSVRSRAASRARGVRQER
jgi:hypothetical protein